MKFLISFVALAFVAVSVDAAWPSDAPDLNKIAGVQASVKNINYAADDLNTMETRLAPLTVDDNINKISAAEDALTDAVDKTPLLNNFKTDSTTT